MTLELLQQIIKERIKDFDGDIYTDNDGDQVAGILRDILEEYEKRKSESQPDKMGTWPINPDLISVNEGRDKK